MIARRPVLLCLFTLFLGVFLGAQFQESMTTPAVQADNAVRSEQTDSSVASAEHALITGSRLLSRIASRTTPSVVHIQSEHTSDISGRTVEETGSGVIVRDRRVPGTFVVTNSHVIRGATHDNISIHLSDGHVVNPIRVIEDPATDIAVIEIRSSKLPAAKWGNSDHVQIGHLVMAMGSPFGLSQSVTLGIISAKGRRDLKLSPDTPVRNQDFLQTDAAINPGNSGGPLVDLEGQVIGINTAIASNSGGNEGIGFSIPSNLVRRVAEELLHHGTVRRAYLGVRLDDHFRLEDARRLGLDRVQGAKVVHVYGVPQKQGELPGTPAARAGLSPDDVVLTFDGIDVIDENHLINLVSLAEVAARVRLIVLRKGKRIPLEVVLTDLQSASRVSKQRSDESRVRRMSQQRQPSEF